VLGVQSNEAWRQALGREDVLQHTVFIASNTLDPQLQLRSLELLLALLTSCTVAAEQLLEGGLAGLCSDVVVAAVEAGRRRRQNRQSMWEDDEVGLGGKDC
jgi:hypothetical protein